jgi:hypothetical protein
MRESMDRPFISLPTTEGGLMMDNHQSTRFNQTIAINADEIVKETAAVDGTQVGDGCCASSSNKNAINVSPKLENALVQVSSAFESTAIKSSSFKDRSNTKPAIVWDCPEIKADNVVSKRGGIILIVNCRRHSTAAWTSKLVPLSNAGKEDGELKKVVENTNDLAHYLETEVKASESMFTLLLINLLTFQEFRSELAGICFSKTRTFSRDC